jgi:RimJ/RimL family protein N-acetyltransferase
VSQEENTQRLPERELSGAPIKSLPPAIWPARIPLEGQYSRLEPIDARVHTEDLFTAGNAVPGSDEVWTYLGYGPFSSEAAFESWVRDCAASADPIFYAIADRAQGRFLGMASMMDIQPKSGGIEIGHIWFGPQLQRTRAATEALYLMMSYAMDNLGYRRLQWKCNALNQPSRNAARRLGFAFEGVLFQHMISKGCNRDTAYFSILDYEWPLIRANFERWLSPENFDDQGRQRVSLGELNQALRG